MNFHFVIVLILFALLVFTGYDFLKSYWASKNIGWQRWLDGAKGSATLLVAQFGYLAAFLMATFDKIMDLVGFLSGDSSTTDAIKGAVNAHFGAYGTAITLAGFMILVGIARYRTLGKPNA